MKYLLAFGLLAMVGCYTQHKAVKQTYRAIGAYPDTTAAILRNWKPCVPGEPVTDSTAYKQYLAELKALEELYGANNTLVVTEVVTDTFVETWTDQAKVKYWQGQAAAKDSRIKKLNSYIADLLKLCEEKPPVEVITPVKDMADVQVAEGKAAKLEKRLATSNKFNRVTAIIAGIGWLLFLILLFIKRKS